MERYCAYQERCHQEVVRKLKEMRMIPDAVDLIVVHLIQGNYLNEERFARTYARGKFRIKHWGRDRIVRELKGRQISAPNIKAALGEIDPGDYLEALDVLAGKRMEQLAGDSPPKQRRKLADYLLYRGWESHLVWDKVEELVPHGS